jgi:cyclopropane fatty-acyl-phospholipid synthase-like methyltransferase
MDSIYTDGKYLEQNRTWHTEDSAWKAQQIADILLSNGVRPETLAEVGCGAGEVLRQLSVRMPGTLMTGYEISPQAFHLCQQRASGALSFRLANLPDEDVFYDCLLCVDVFEHIENSHSFVRAIRTKAKTKIFHIPLDISVWSLLKGEMLKGRKSVGHIHYYTRDAAIAFLEDCGYRIVDERYTRLFDHVRASHWKSRLLQCMQKAGYAASPHKAVLLLGGCSLLVIAE